MTDFVSRDFVKKRNSRNSPVRSAERSKRRVVASRAIFGRVSGLLRRLLVVFGVLSPRTITAEVAVAGLVRFRDGEVSRYGVSFVEGNGHLPLVGDFLHGTGADPGASRRRKKTHFLPFRADVSANVLISDALKFTYVTRTEFRFELPDDLFRENSQSS